MSYVFVLTYKQFVETDTRHKNLIKTPNKNHAYKELFSFKNFIYENVDIHKMKECKTNAINRYFFGKT